MGRWLSRYENRKGKAEGWKERKEERVKEGKVWERKSVIIYVEFCDFSAREIARESDRDWHPERKLLYHGNRRAEWPMHSLDALWEGMEVIFVPFLR